MSNERLVAEVRAFFDLYNQVFASFGGDEIATLYHVPTVTLRGDGSIHCLQSREVLAGFFQGVVDSYRKDGYAESRYVDLEVVPIGGASALATMTWEMLGEDGRVVRAWRQSYNLVRTGEGWRILVSTFHVPAAAALA